MRHTKDEALKLALKALENTYALRDDVAEAIAAIKQALAAPPVQEPDDSLLLCASDLEHSAIYDNHVEMQACIRAVASRIKAFAATPPAQPAPVTLITFEQHIALREAFAINSADLYFEANPTHDNDVGRMLFERGFARGFDSHELAIETAKKGQQ